MESNATETRIPCSRSTRDLVRSLKRGGESYDDLLEKMAKQYDPATAEVSDGVP